MKALTLKQIDEMLYKINRRISLSIAFEKDIKKQHRLSHINKEIVELIKYCRTYGGKENDKENKIDK